MDENRNNKKKTAVSYNFVKWALGFGKMLGIDIPGKNFGIK